MATDFVSAVLSNLRNLLVNESDLLDFVCQQMKQLESHLSIIGRGLADIEQEILIGSSHAVSDWLQKLMDAVYLLDDVLDECSIEAIRDKYEGGRSCAFLSFLQPENIMFRRMILLKMKSINSMLDIVVRERDCFFLPIERQATWSSLGRTTDSFVLADSVVGREYDKMKILEQLLECGSEDDGIQVLSLVGPAGIGKTTLAQLVYNDEISLKHFSARTWISVAGNLDLVKLMKSILVSAYEDRCSYDMDNMSFLMAKVQAILLGKRFLMVLDDVYCEDPDRWTILRDLLAGGLNGSTILVTTRERRTAVTASGNRGTYHLTGLSEEDCWQIFRSRAFRNKVEETPNLVAIGKELVHKCRGEILVVKALAGLLYTESNENLWLRVKEHSFSKLQQVNDVFISTIMPQYLAFPPRLRRSFTYLAIFPKDYRIEKEGLIKLWMANGLIPCNEATSLEIEDIGDEMVDELYWKSLIEDIKIDDSGKIQSFKVNSLLHDFAKHMAGYDVCILDGPELTELPPRTRHLSVDYASDASRASPRVDNVESLRTLINLGSPCSSEYFANLLKHPCIRALDLSFVADLKGLPPSVGFLKHLRYLNLSNTRIEVVPEFITSLWNLQVLNLNRCKELKMLPQSMGRLERVRHLYLTDCWNLPSLPRSMSRLTALRTLTLVIVGDVLDFKLSDLGRFGHLRGKLTIKQLERVRDVRDAQHADLAAKNNLQELELRWGRIDDVEDSDHKQQQMNILEALEPAKNLEQLVLSGYRGSSFPRWMMNQFPSFPQIQSVSLTFCRHCSTLPPFWRLPSLKQLRLEDIDCVRCLIEDEYTQHDNDDDNDNNMSFTFQSLESLTIRRLPRLENITQKGEAVPAVYAIFPRLSHLIIYGTRLDLSTLDSLGSLPSVQKFSMVEV